MGLRGALYCICGLPERGHPGGLLALLHALGGVMCGQLSGVGSATVEIFDPGVVEVGLPQVIPRGESGKAALLIVPAGV